MKKFALGVAFFSTLVLAACANVHVLSGSGYKPPRSQVVALVDAHGGNGSGVVIAPGVILTARHVAAVMLAGRQLYVEPGHIPVKSVERVGTGKVDLAIMHADVKCPCATIAAKPAATDEPVIIVGYPARKIVGVEVLTHGAAQGVSDSPDAPYLMTTAQAAGGNSGGGVFAYRGGAWKLIGILIAAVNQPGESVFGSVAVPTNYLSVVVGNKSVRSFVAGKLSQAAADYHPDTGTL